MISSTPLRKSINKKQTDDYPCTPIEPEVDDDSERRRRRSAYDAHHRLSNVPDSIPASTESIEQMTNHIKMCQKLCDENKINIRNAWEMKVIDYIHHYVSKNTLLQSDVILEGARMLEVCVKVYGYKVEYLSQEVIKLVSMKKAQPSNDEENSIVDDDNVQEHNLTRRKRQKKRKGRSQATVAKERDLVLVPEISKVVPIDFIGSVDIYATNHQNMFTNKVLMDHSAYKFNLLNNEDCGFISYNEKDPTPEVKLFPVTFPKIKSFIICTEFKNFNVDEEDKEFNESIASIINENNRPNAQAVLESAVVYDNDGMPVPELDGSMHDVFADCGDVEDDEVVAVGQTAQRRVEMITSFCPTEAPIQKNNSLHSTSANAFLETVWVGPSHWKNKLIRPSVPRYSGKSDEKIAQAKKKRKTAVRLKDSLIDINNSIDINLEKKSKSSISFIKSRCTLPPIDLLRPDFLEMITRRIIPVQEYQLEKSEPEFEHSPYDYNNANDSEYCSQVDLHDLSDNAANDDNNVVHENGEHMECNGTELDHDGPVCFNTTNALIDAPDLVTQVYVPYALRAKHVNMKKLKSVMLGCLTHDSHVENHEIHVPPTSFSTVFKELPSKLSKKENCEISVALAYFCLLHITNEYNLKLSESPALNDATIEKL